ncbi:MAG: manganese efflux pump MntP family protein [Oscillospiraceae bacterium]|nr:manganese efflux pump MntP family protein [Oscillospiraceae bacterium]
MGVIEILLVALGLSMDAFAVSLCKGLSVERAEPKNALAAGAYFGAAQGLMTLLGCLLGESFRVYIESVDHWIAFGLLLLIGVNMIREAAKDGDCKQESEPFAFKNMILLALATSIDALAVGVSFAVLENINIALAASIIALVTFVLSGAGVYVGNAFGSRLSRAAETAGGGILILIGVKILLEHLGFLSF